MPVSTAKLVDFAMRLRAEAPESWAGFTHAMREYAAAQAAEMVRCPPEMLAKAQGMAITATDIASTLNNAPQLYDKTRNNG